MFSRVAPGAHVLTRFGEGTVLKVRGNNVLVEVHEYELPLNFEVSELRVLKAGTVEENTAAPTPSDPPSGRPKAALVEALRFGLVPRDGIRELTVGYDRIERWTHGRLPTRSATETTFSEIVGPFGTGKSHTLAVVRHVAESRGFVTAQVEIDGKKVTLSNPEGLLFALWRNLTIDGEECSTPLLELYVRAIRTHGERTPQELGPLERIRTNYETARMLSNKGLIDKYGPSLDAIVSSSPEVAAGALKKEIAAEPGISPWDFDVRRMVGLRVDERPRDFVASLVGHAWMARLAGYEGLVVMLDELEIEHLDRSQLARVAAVLEALAEYLRGDSHLPEAPLAIFAASVGQEGHIGDVLLEYLLEEARGERYEVGTLSRSELASLAERVWALYRDAYDIEDADPPWGERVAIESPGTESTDSGFVRDYIKRLVALCDSLYGPCRDGRRI